MKSSHWRFRVISELGDRLLLLLSEAGREQKLTWREVEQTMALVDGHSENGNGHRHLSATDNGQMATTIAMQTTDWLWEGRLPRGMLSGFDGDPERGKSQHLCLWAAHITTGKPWPDGSPCPQGNVILIGAEDSWSRTVVPRLTAAGADLSRVRLLSKIEDHLVSIPEDIPVLEHLIKLEGVVQISFDPLSAFLSDQVNANSEHDVRRALTPLAEMLTRTNCNAVAARHLSKNDKVGNALYRGLGSIGFSAVARTVLGVAKDPEEKGTYIFSVLKNNLAPKPRSQHYTMETVAVAEGIETSRVVWGSMTDVSPEELMTAFGKPQPRQSAKLFLEEFLAAGAVDSQLIFEAGQAAGLSRNTLYRAKDEIGIKPQKEGYQGRWMWALPEPKIPSPSKIPTIFEGEESSNTTSQRSLHSFLGIFDDSSSKVPNQQSPPAGARANGCPNCGDYAFDSTPLGDRRCRKCGATYQQ